MSFTVSRPPLCDEQGGDHGGGDTGEESRERDRRVGQLDAGRGGVRRLVRRQQIDLDEHERRFLARLREQAPVGEQRVMLAMLQGTGDLDLALAVLEGHAAAGRDAQDHRHLTGVVVVKDGAGALHGTAAAGQAKRGREVDEANDGRWKHAPVSCETRARNQN
ncbi:MAG TPA: hypothetical protein VGF28_01305 [Thermoanaerobaculia bacterium]